MSVLCPQLSKLTADTVILTKDNIGELILSTYSRTVGTEVTVQCRDGYNRIGAATVTCQANGQWSSTPYCSDSPEASPTNSLLGDMSTEQLAIIIGAAVAGLIVLIVLIFLIVMLCRGKRRDKEIIYRNQYNYRDEFRDDRSYRPYSISGKRPVEEHMHMHNMYSPPVPVQAPQSTTHHHRHTALPEYNKQTTYVEDRILDHADCTHCHHCHKHEVPRREEYVPPPTRETIRETHHCAQCEPRQQLEPRHLGGGCPRCDSPVTVQQELVRRPESIRRFNSTDDVRDVVVRRELVQEDVDTDKYIRAPRRDGYLWRGMYDAGWTIPRPYYET